MSAKKQSGHVEERVCECVPYVSSEDETARKPRLLVLLPYSIWNKKQARHPQGPRACLRIALDSIATPGVVLRFFLIHTFICLLHHIHDMHVPLGPHLPKRQGFGIRFIGLPLERGDLRIKDPLRNVRAEEDKFVSANTEKIISPEIAAEYPADVPDVFIAGVMPLLIVDAL